MSTPTVRSSSSTSVRSTRSSIARRVREAHVYSEVVPSTTPAGRDARPRPCGGDPLRRAVLGLRRGAPQVDAALFDAGVPAFGICYGFQAMALALGGEVERTGLSEFGRTPLTLTAPSTLLAGLPTELSVWMSHGDAVAARPEGSR